MLLLLLTDLCVHRLCQAGGFNMAGVPAFYDLKDEKQAKQYLDKVGIEYRFQCYDEKRPDGCHRLGDYLEAFKRDYEKALKVYAKNCSENQYGASCFKLGQYRLLGRMGPKDPTAAFEAYRLGCDSGHGPSCHNAALMCQSGDASTDEKNKFVKAASFLKRGCDSDDIPSCQLLSAYYITGKEGLERNMEQAFAFAMKACDRGHMYACGNVARMYKLGEGVAKNEELARQYEKRAKELYKSVTEGEKTIKFSE